MACPVVRHLYAGRAKYLNTMIIFWFNNHTLRLEDNIALNAAIKSKKPIILLYIYYEHLKPRWGIQGAASWYLHGALDSLQKSLKKLNAELIIQKGRPSDILAFIASKYPIEGVYWNRSYEPFERAEENLIQQKLKYTPVHIYNSSLLYEPESIKNTSNEPFLVFTPFWKACLKNTPPASRTENLATASFANIPLDTLSVEALNLLPKNKWYLKLYRYWVPSAEKAQDILDKLVGEKLKNYDHARDIPSEDGTSRLSPYLRFGQISIRELFHRIKGSNYQQYQGATRYLAELGWREFAYHLLYHFPETTQKPLKSKFNKFPWQTDNMLIQAWQRGLTGYPIVDAGMRQLYQTGWMHNRVRMIVGSFLVKHLLQPWQSGAEWFWDTLVDADLANNSLGWQWVAGSGADAAPFFRIFNPVLQSEKFDPEGVYIKAYLPELAKLPAKYIHKPYEAPASILDYANIKLGTDYPLPIVDLNKKRLEALAIFKNLG